MGDQPVITIAGSYRKHAPRILAAAGRFRELGATVLRPASDEIVLDHNEVVLLAGDPHDIQQLHRQQFDAIDATASARGLVFIVNPGGYMGSAAIANAAWAVRAGALVICSEPPFEAVATQLDGADPMLELRSEEYALAVLNASRPR